MFANNKSKKQKGRGPPHPYSVSRRDEAQQYADWRATWWTGEVKFEAMQKWAEETGLLNPYVLTLRPDLKPVRTVGVQTEETQTVQGEIKSTIEGVQDEQVEYF